MKDKKKRTEPLDTETSFADMNVDGMPWYEPPKKDGTAKADLSKHEQRALLRGTFLAALPMLGGALLVMALLYLLVYLWLH